MKRYFLRTLFVAAIATVSVPVLAQKAKDKDDKTKKSQTIVITRTENTDEKLVIEVKGDKVTVNGKEPGKDDDVKVKVHTMNRPNTYSRALTSASGGGTDSWVIRDGQMSLFAEDSNRAMLGIVTDANDKGAEVTQINKASAAEKAGLKTGDIITKIGDKKIEDAEDVSDAVRAKKPGDKVAITVLRDGKEQTVNAELGKWKGISMNTLIPSKIEMNNMDFNKGNYAPSLRSFTGVFGNQQRLGLSIQDTEDGKGVKITEVEEESNAAKAGIKENDVITKLNDTEVNSADEVSKIVRENKEKTTPLKFQVTREGKSQTIEVRIPRKLKTADL
jgi:serine protease Do